MTTLRFDPRMGWQTSCFFLLFALPSLYQLVTSGAPTWKIATGLRQGSAARSGAIG